MAEGASAGATPPARGRLVVATPTLVDPNFARTVVLVLDHGARGTLGVMLDRATSLALVDIVEDWAPLAAAPAVVFRGGPVQPNALIGLARLREGDTLEHDWEPVTPGVGVVNLGRDPALRQSQLAGIRVFAGYSGWGPGQLENELRTGSWFVVPSTPGDGFTADPPALWTSVLRRQGGVYTTIPRDPTSN